MRVMGFVSREGRAAGRVRIELHVRRMRACSDICWRWMDLFIESLFFYSIDAVEALDFSSNIGIVSYCLV